MNLLEQFKNVYSNELISKGFSLLKSKYPYFIKVTTDGIIQLISVEKKKSDFLNLVLRRYRSSAGQECFISFEDEL